MRPATSTSASRARPPEPAAIMPQAYRYAAYLAPTDSWRELGRAWLGRCEETGQRLARSRDDDPRLDAWTDAPRHYGLHATLKPPFQLRAGTTARALDAAMRTVARSQSPFAVTLTLRALRGFLAWCLTEDATDHARIRALADRAVRDLDAYRAPPTAAELARRRPDRLTPAQQQMLAQWGYPYVFDTYTFHITLTGQLGETDLRHAQELLTARSVHTPAGSMPVRAVSLYVQPAPDTPFVVARHYGFDGTTRDAAGACYLHDDAP
jgi:2'-5' RNA ligase